MSTIALFITVFILLCIFALIFVCYRAGRDSRAQSALQDEEVAAMQRATIVLSIVPGSAAAAALSAQQPYSSQRARAVANRKTPTPPTIIRNLPVVIWDKPKPAPASTPAQQGMDAGAGKKAGNKDQDDVQHSKGSKDADAAGYMPDTQGQQEDGDSKECMCVICCCDYEVGEQIKLLPCLHMYHQLCIDAWLERSHVCPVCQADVIRAAGLSAAMGDWSVHTQEAVNIISGVQHHSDTSLLYPQQQQQQNTTQQQQQRQQQQPGPQATQEAPSLPVSSPPAAAVGVPLAAPAAAAVAPTVGQPFGSSQGHSTDAVALVVAREPAAAPATFRSGLGFRM